MTATWETWAWLEEQLTDIFKQYGTHENLTTKRLAMEVQRRIELLQSRQTDIPPISETQDQ